MMNRRSSQLNLVSEHPFNAETPLSALGTNITPNELFYVRNHFDVPDAEAEDWSVGINQLVSHPQVFSLDDLRSLPVRTLTVLMECAGNARSTLVPPINGTPWNFGAVAQAEFTGTPLQHLLEIVKPMDSAVEVLFTGADQGEVRTGEFTAYARSLPLELANQPDILLAWEMNGEPLPPNHGYPLRLVVPSWYGMASVKWLKEISLIAEPFRGFFQAGDYVYVEADGIPDGTPVREVLVRSLILSPADGSQHEGKSIEVNGIAWSGHGDIVEVCISPDGGENWHTANIETPAGPYSWTRWNLNLEIVKTGNISLLSRAADSAGNVQPMVPVWNRGGYGNNPVHKVSITVR